jgi:hypothetical protein
MTAISILYAGVRYALVGHAVYCKKCLETIESKHGQDFKYCACGAVGIDGGLSDGNRILENPSDMEDRSIYCAIIQNKKIWLPSRYSSNRSTLSEKEVFFAK